MNENRFPNNYRGFTHICFLVDIWDIQFLQISVASNMLAEAFSSSYTRDFFASSRKLNAGSRVTATSSSHTPTVFSCPKTMEPESDQVYKHLNIYVCNH